MSKPTPAQEALVLVPSTDADVVPSRKLWVELSTRVFTQSLHYRSGDEETAASSVHSLFDTCRGLMREHPEARAFEQVTLIALNDVIRPYTARWHRWMVDQQFADEQRRRRFRRELQELQVAIEPVGASLLAMSRKEKVSEELRAALERSSQSGVRVAHLGTPIESGIGPQVHMAGSEKPGSVTRMDLDAAEHREIGARRRLLGTEKPGDGAVPGSPVERVMDATALCLSGGGIRSATFCLGAVQVLARHGMMRQVDYVSTVSGGGYLGSFITCFLGTHRESVAKASGASVSVPAPTASDVQQRWKDALGPKEGRESSAIRHLRNNSKYLLNGGVWGRLMIFGLLAGGVALNLLLVLPMPLLAAVAVAVLERVGFWEERWGSGEGWAQPWSSAGLLVGFSAAVFAVLWFLLPKIEAWTHGAKPFTSEAKLRGFWEGATLVAALTVAGSVALCAVPEVLKAWHALLAWMDLKWMGNGGSLFVVGSGLLPLVLGPVGAQLSGGASGGWKALLRRAVPVLFLASGPLFYFLSWLWVAERLTRDGVGVGTVSVVGGAALALLVWGWCLVNVNTLSPHRYYRARLCECYLAMRGMDQRGWLWRWWSSWWRGNTPPDGSGGHGMLAKADEFGTLQNVPLTATGTTLASPYHIVNATVNVPASDDRNLRGRDGDFFLFSKHYCGSPVTGYVATSRMQEMDRHLDLGTAMAISAAAASANMGIKSIRRYRFLLALFNIRLGYWLPHPQAKKAVRPGATYLLREMTGRLNESSDLVNVSDGGHIENLAMYEMLRRRCRYIVCLDAGQEPGLECVDLYAVQRYAAIDLGVTLEFDPGDLRKTDAGLSRSHAVFGKIRYPGIEGDPRSATEQTGWFVYLKLSVTGGEPGYVGDYRRRVAEFPHQSTGDQLYDEAQFEAYRALGETAMEALFRDELRHGLPGSMRAACTVDAEGRWQPSVEQWFQVLATNLLPDNDPAFGPAAP